MKEQIPPRRKRAAGRSYDLDDKESEASALGAPTRGFEEDAEYDRARDLGFTFEGDHTAWNPEGETSDTETIDFTPEEERLPGDLEDASAPQTDLRYGQEDISGVSEWSMRARSPELDDGVDMGDFDRSDDEIQLKTEEALEEVLPENKLRVEVQAGEVTLSGTVEQEEVRSQAEDAVLAVEGVREVRNRIEVQDTRR